MEVTQPLVARAAMLIRRPSLDCYEAFVDPAITSKFWFSAGSDRLDAGRQVIWTWGMYGVSSRIDVKELVPGHRIVIDWDAGTEHASIVEWLFVPRADGATFVDIRNHGFTGEPDKQVQQLVDSTDGFSLVVAGAKAWLEQGLNLRLVEDRHPDMLVEGWKPR
ncbi:MAG: SRPBCC family protein [Mesorhizobium sp.]